jgi:branched-chain amino acid transport system permease protein
MLAVIDAQTIVDALGIGSVYALMAVGIGLVFGVLRLVNFAYGQLIMAGALTLAYASREGWPTWVAIVACFAVVIGLSLLMELAVFRPLRTESPAVMLVATFAVSFLLQSIALLAVLKIQGQLGMPASVVARLSQAVTIAGVDVRKVTIVSLVVAVLALGALALLLEKTTVGLQMRAAATDFTTARLLGISANRVIGFAVLLAGVIAAIVAVLLTARTPYVQSDFALHDMIYVLVGVVVGGIDRLWTATLGGFTIGFASGIIYGALPTDQTAYLPSVLFALVIVVLLVRPAGLFAPRGTTTVERV